MNIFYISECPRQAAEWMVDKHVVKMILESAQLLSTAHRVIDGQQLEVTYKIPAKVVEMPFEGTKIVKPAKMRKKKVWVLEDGRNDTLYNATHINHPSAVWARESVSNYIWLAEHMLALGDEYRFRYGKTHKTIEKLGYILQSPPLGLINYAPTQMPSCMPEEYILGSQDPISNYRNYYKYGKARMHAWKKREAPSWIL